MYVCMYVGTLIRSEVVDSFILSRHCKRKYRRRSRLASPSRPSADAFSRLLAFFRFVRRFDMSTKTTKEYENTAAGRNSNTFRHTNTTRALSASSLSKAAQPNQNARVDGNVVHAHGVKKTNDVRRSTNAKKRTGAANGAAAATSGNNAHSSSTGGDDLESGDSFLSPRKFSNADVRAALSNATLKTVEHTFGYTNLSKVQALTMAPLLASADMFAKSKTGSGKTMAFLVPAVERAYAAKRMEAETSSIPAFKYVRVFTVVVCPTKELAAQTYEEGVKLLRFDERYHMRAALMIGGVNKGGDLRTLQDKRSDVALLVATPGRLADHIATTPGFKNEVMAGVKMVVLDEADRMLEAGFRSALETILDAVPKDKRQTVLISATMPEGLLEIAAKYMRPGWRVVDTGGGNSERQDHEVRVNPSVHHRALIVTHEQHPHALLQAMCEHAAARPSFKIIVFFPFVKQVQLMAAFFRMLAPPCLGPQTQLLEIHSDLNQAQRQRMSDAFRNSSRAVLFGTDVIARGVDYPDVSFVLQSGITDRESYVHRVGRTGRAGRTGDALLVVVKFAERYMRKQLEGLGVEWLRAIDPRKSAAQNARVQSVQNASAPATPVVVAIRPDVIKAGEELARRDPKLYRRAFASWIGAYGSKARELGVSKPQLELQAVEEYRALGMREVPEISPMLRKKMGLPPTPPAAPPPLPPIVPPSAPVDGDLGATHKSH